jgi:hypothetical protein
MPERPSTGLQIPSPIENRSFRPQTFLQKGKSAVQVAEIAESTSMHKMCPVIVYEYWAHEICLTSAKS